MWILLSPAKRLQEGAARADCAQTQPALIEHARPLAEALRQKTPEELAKLFRISAKLATQCHEWMQRWRPDPWPAEAAQAIFLFRGDAYQALRAWTMDATTLERAQQRLRILSGLYGILRPCDLIMPHRLPMGTPLSVGNASDLYDYWHQPLNARLAEEIAKSGDRLVLNLASKEYFRAVDPGMLQARIIEVRFLQKTANGWKTIGVVAKRARGAMARWLLANGIRSEEDAKHFDADGWRFCDENPNEWVFTRDAR